LRELPILKENGVSNEAFGRRLLPNKVGSRPARDLPMTMPAFAHSVVMSPMMVLIATRT
jgi:hypothetical protein